MMLLVAFVGRAATPSSTRRYVVNALLSTFLCIPDDDMVDAHGPEADGRTVAPGRTQPMGPVSHQTGRRDRASTVATERATVSVI